MPQKSPRSPLAAVLLAALLLAAVPGAAVAESPPEAQAWLDKLVGLYDQAPFTLGYSATIDLGQMGQPIRGTLDGEVTFGDRHHLRQEMKMSLAGMPAAGEGGGGEAAATEMEMLSVSDAAVIWTEVRMPGLAAPQVMKISRAAAEQMAAGQAGAALGPNPAAMDPVAQLETISREMDFELLAVADGRVTLAARVTAESQAHLGQLGALGVDSFLLVLDAENGHPLEIRAGEPPVVHLRFRDLELVERGDLAAGTFEYTPPDGVAVTDLGAAAGSAGD